MPLPKHMKIYEDKGGLAAKESDEGSGERPRRIKREIYAKLLEDE